MDSPFVGDSYPEFWTSNVAENDMKEFALKFFKPTTQDELAEDRSWLYRKLTNDPRIVLKCMGKQLKVWRKKAKVDIGANPTPAGDDNPNAIQVELPDGATLAPNGSIRVMIEGKKYSLYRVESVVDVKVIEFYIEGGTKTLILPSSCKDSRVLIDFEEDISSSGVFHPYYLQLERPSTIRLDEDSTINNKPNFFYLTWRQGDKYNENAHKNIEFEPGAAELWSDTADYNIGQKVKISSTPVRYFQCKTAVERTEVLPSIEKPSTGTEWTTYWDEIFAYSAEPAWLDYKMVQETKWSWYKCNSQTIQYVQDWLPIEYWFNIDGASAVAVIMGDPGMSATDYLSSPAYFGQLEQIEGALETDDKGNFACFSGADQNPQSRNEKADISGEIPRLKRFGDYTATGITDIMLTSSKSGRPFQGHKVGLFGMYEFKEQTFNGQSSHTNKHSVTDIVVADVHENERGILRNCLGVPKLGKEHGVELVADRYMANKEKTYIFLHINSLYTPFNTGNDVLIGIAIRTDN